LGDTSQSAFFKIYNTNATNNLISQLSSIYQNYW